MQLWAYQNMLYFPLILALIFFCDRHIFGYLSILVCVILAADLGAAAVGFHGMFLGNTMTFGVAASVLPLILMMIL